MFGFNGSNMMAALLLNVAAAGTGVTSVHVGTACVPFVVLKRCPAQSCATQITSGLEGATAIVAMGRIDGPHFGSVYGSRIFVHVGGLPVSTSLERHSDCPPASMRL